MSSVDTAASHAAYLLSKEARGPGDLPSAMHRIEAKFGIPFWAQWALRYRKPKAVTVDLFQRIQQAYWATCERQLENAAHDVALARAAKDEGNDADQDLVAEVESLLAKIKARRG